MKPRKMMFSLSFPQGLLDMFRCMKIDPDVVRDAIVGGGVQI